MAKLGELLEKSVLIQGTLTLGVTCCACYLWVTGQAVPDTLLALLGLAWGFYFRSKAGVEVRSNIVKDQES